MNERVTSTLKTLFDTTLIPLNTTQDMFIDYVIGTEVSRCKK